MPDREVTSTNALVTGPPRSGKTTALEQTVSGLRDHGLAVDGLVSPEIREDGESAGEGDETDGRRIGFEIAALSSDCRATMAHIDRGTGPSVGKYRVDVAAVDRVAGAALERARDEADCIVIDEIAPMQLESERFVLETRRALESSVPVLAAIKADATSGVLGEVKSRTDVNWFEVDPETRDELPDRLVEWVVVRCSRC